MKDYVKSEQANIFQTYKRLPVVVEKADGCRITDKKGDVYLDFLGGIAVNALGYGHPAILKAIQEQSARYLHLSNYFYQDIQIELAEKLKEMTGFDRVFYTNSGTEANEGAIKLIRRWGKDKGKNEIISFSGGFHGRTYGALSMMDKPHYKDGMGPFLDGMKIIEYNNIYELEKSVTDKTAAVVLEFLQGEGGISAPTIEFVEKINELKDKFGFLVLADEIQAGVGRTGKFFGFEHYDTMPDIVTMAKGIGGGLPLGAILGRENLEGIWEKGMHGTTYGGNALACATGLAVLKELESGLMEKIVETGNYLHRKLEEIKEEYREKVLEVRGRGLMKGLLLSFDAGIIVNKLVENKAIANAASGTVLRMVPPLIIDEKDVDEFIAILRKCLNDV